MMENSDELVEIEFDLSLARGLNYYTGIIYSCCSDSNIGSLGGGGRYSDLTKSLVLITYQA